MNTMYLVIKSFGSQISIISNIPGLDSVSINSFTFGNIQWPVHIAWHCLQILSISTVRSQHLACCTIAWPNIWLCGNVSLFIAGQSNKVTFQPHNTSRNEQNEPLVSWLGVSLTLLSTSIRGTLEDDPNSLASLYSGGGYA